jgi:hypothetical protein
MNRFAIQAARLNGDMKRMRDTLSQVAATFAENHPEQPAEKLETMAVLDDHLRQTITALEKFAVPIILTMESAEADPLES